MQSVTQFHWNSITFDSRFWTGGWWSGMPTLSFDKYEVSYSIISLFFWLILCAHKFYFFISFSLHQLLLTQSYGEVPQRCRINRCMPEGTKVRSIHLIDCVLNWVASNYNFHFLKMLVIGTDTCVLNHISIFKSLVQSNSGGWSI